MFIGRGRNGRYLPNEIFQDVLLGCQAQSILPGKPGCFSLNPVNSFTFSVSLTLLMNLAPAVNAVRGRFIRASYFSPCIFAGFSFCDAHLFPLQLSFDPFDFHNYV